MPESTRNTTPVRNKSGIELLERLLGDRPMQRALLIKETVRILTILDPLVEEALIRRAINELSLQELTDLLPGIRTEVLKAKLADGNAASEANL